MSSDIKYFSPNDLAKKKGLSVQVITKYCRAGFYAGAYQDANGRWHIPANVVDADIPLRHGGPRAGSGRHPLKKPRKLRGIYTTEDEWDNIKALADKAKLPVNEFLLKKSSEPERAVPFQVDQQLYEQIYTIADNYNKKNPDNQLTVDDFISKILCAGLEKWLDNQLTEK